MENLRNPCYHYSINRLGAPLTPAVDILRRKFVIASECSERGDLRPLIKLLRLRPVALRPEQIARLLRGHPIDFGARHFKSASHLLLTCLL